MDGAEAFLGIPFAKPPVGMLRLSAPQPPARWHGVRDATTLPPACIQSGLSFHHAVAHALWAGKLFHIDLNAQRIGRYDQDFRFGAEDLKEAFMLVRLLERAGHDGPLHFDAHAYRNEDAEGVWSFA